MTTETKLTNRDENLPEETRTDRQVTPFVDIYENQDELLLRADMPGVLSEALDVRIDKDVLIIEGKKQLDSDDGLLRCELAPCTYTRSFSLPKTIDREKIDASLERGVLEVHMPKRESVKPRRIQVTAS